MDKMLVCRCLELAENGAGYVAPNPMVGAVVVYGDQIIGEGYHRVFGGPHAEVQAINSVADKNLLKESVLYVNLEPCSHHGKTPPCADLIIHHKIPKIVIAQMDPNPLVAGSGVERLRAAGVEVTTDVLEDEASYLNRRFNTFHSQRRPYVVLKWAQSSDGFMDVQRHSNVHSGIHWISHPNTKKLVHHWRSREQAILVGAGTIRNDNPALTVREVAGNSPLRMVLSASGKLPEGSQVLTDGLPTWVVSKGSFPSNKAVSYLKAAADESLVDAAMRLLFENAVSSVMVEGGAQTLGAFISTGLWDEARIVTSPHRMPPGTGGVKSPSIQGVEKDRYDFGGDHVSIIQRSGQ